MLRPITIGENLPGDNARYPSRHPSMLLQMVCHLDYSSCCTSFPNWTLHSTSTVMQKDSFLSFFLSGNFIQAELRSTYSFVGFWRCSSSFDQVFLCPGLLNTSFAYVKHPYSTGRARQMPPGSFGAIKQAAHRQRVFRLNPWCS